MNYMQQVAEMLDVKFLERFYLDGVENTEFMLLDDGLNVCVNEYTSRISTNIRLEDILCGKVKIIKLSNIVLDEKEKEYLSAVIKPFRDRVIDIVKRDDDIYEYIVIVHRRINGEEEYIYFPFFKKGKMYKGMKTDRKYSLEELGL